MGKKKSGNRIVSDCSLFRLKLSWGLEGSLERKDKKKGMTEKYNGDSPQHLWETSEPH